MPADGPFYLQPKRKWSYSDNLWFESRPIGWNMLAKRFKEMCKDAGLTGNFTNHSGRATSITHLYDAGVLEKSIMKRSGHQSIEGV
jgi:integrase